MRKFNLHDEVLFDNKEGVICAIYSNEEFDIVALDVYVYSEKTNYEDIAKSKLLKVDCII